MTGTREMSGLGGDEVQERNHRLLTVQHSLLSMFTSMTWAPFSTCSRATSRAVFVVVVQDQILEPRRSRHIRPLPDVDEQSESGPMLTGSSPERRILGGSSGISRGG